MQMQVDLDWCSTKRFSKKNKAKAMATNPSPRSSIAATVVLSNSPMEFSILSYHIPLHAMSIEEKETKGGHFPSPKSGQGKPKGSSAIIKLPVPTVPTVHFPDDDQLVIVFEFDDDLESKETRLCYWEVFARDRARFKDRIEQASEILNPILEQSHRDQVYSKLHSEQSDDTVDGTIPSDSLHTEENDPTGSGDSVSSSSTGKKRRRRRRRNGKKHRK